MIHIVGLGGVGFWLAVGLSKVVPPDQLHCWDDDDLSGTGADRLPWGPQDTKKTDLLKGYLGMVHAQVGVPTISERRFSGLLNVDQNDLVIDCTDMALPLRRRMWSSAKNRGAKMLRVSYDGRGSTIVISTGLPLYGSTNGGYVNIPSMALSLAAGGLGAEAIRRYLRNPMPIFTTTVSLGEVLPDDQDTSSASMPTH